MAVKTGNFFWGPMAGISIGPVAGTDYIYKLDDADDSICAIFCIPKDGTVNKVGIRINAITGDPPAYNVGIVTVVAGDATAVAYGGSAIESYDFTVTGWIWVTLTTPATVAAGDIAAVRVWPGASAPDASNCVTIITQYLNDYSNLRVPRSEQYATSWTVYQFPSMAAMYNDGSVALPAITSSLLDYDSGATPDEVGNIFQMPFDCKCVGALLSIYPEASTSDFTVKLYDAASALLKSITVDVDEAGLTALGYQQILVHWDEQALAKDTDYRITILPTSLNDIRVPYITLNEAASREWYMEGVRWQGTQRTDGGAWTDSTTKLLLLSLVLSEITLAEAGGGGAEPMAGLMIG